jgi:hypothetical protein
MSDFKREPDDFQMLFDFVRYKKTKNVLHQVASDFLDAMK